MSTLDRAGCAMSVAKAVGGIMGLVLPHDWCPKCPYQWCRQPVLVLVLLWLLRVRWCLGDRGWNFVRREDWRR